MIPTICMSRNYQKVLRERIETQPSVVLTCSFLVTRQFALVWYYYEDKVVLKNYKLEKILPQLVATQFLHTTVKKL